MSARWLTDDNGRDLGDLAHVVVGLHDALYAGDGEVHGDVDIVLGGGRGGALLPLAAHFVGHGLGRVGHVVGIVDALLLGEAAGHAGRKSRAGGGRRVGQRVRDGATVALVLGMDGLVVVLVVA